MSETTKNQAMENENTAIEVVEEKGLRGWIKKNKEKLIIGAVATAVTGAVVCIVKALRSSNDDCDCNYYDEDDYIESTAEEIE